jgi:hypothetical protein
MTPPLGARGRVAPSGESPLVAPGIVHPSTLVPDAPFEPRETPDPDEYRELEEWEEAA